MYVCVCVGVCLCAWKPDADVVFYLIFVLDRLTPLNWSFLIWLGSLGQGAQGILLPPLLTHPNTPLPLSAEVPDSC